MAISRTYKDATSGQSTLFAEDSPARIFRQRENAPESTATTPDSGKNTPGLLANFDLDTRSWRTSQLSLFGGLAEFSQTWPRSGMTRNGTAYQLDPLAPLTDETGSGLWPTPMAQDGGAGARSLRGALDGTFHMTLHRAVELDRLHRDSSGTIDLTKPIPPTGKLNPRWIEWLMGYPDGWTEIED